MHRSSREWSRCSHYQLCSWVTAMNSRAATSVERTTVVPAVLHQWRVDHSTVEERVPSCPAIVHVPLVGQWPRSTACCQWFMRNTNSGLAALHSGRRRTMVVKPHEQFRRASCTSLSFRVEHIAKQARLDAKIPRFDRGTELTLSSSAIYLHISVWWRRSDVDEPMVLP